MNLMALLLFANKMKNINHQVLVTITYLSIENDNNHFPLKIYKHNLAILLLLNKTEL